MEHIRTSENIKINEIYRFLFQALTWCLDGDRWGCYQRNWPMHHSFNIIGDQQIKEDKITVSTENVQVWVFFFFLENCNYIFFSDE